MRQIGKGKVGVDCSLALFTAEYLRELRREPQRRRQMYPVILCAFSAFLWFLFALLKDNSNLKNTVTVAPAMLANEASRQVLEARTAIA
jgi:hypothetical protein